MQLVYFLSQHPKNRLSYPVLILCRVMGSGIFKSKKGNLIYHRVSFMSDFGKSTFVSRAKGIWQITNDNLRRAPEVMNLKNF